MSRYTRLATTISSRYVRQEGAADGFYLDGRMSNAAKFTSKDITLDRTDEGFYLVIYAACDLLKDQGKVWQQKKRSLDRITAMIKDESSGSIDAVINDMAENALQVAGRLSLGDERQRHPYYAGILVKDSEMVAVTTGDAMVCLYRNDILYPMTETDFRMEPIDFQGRHVENYDVFSAGRAGTIRYSNISQLQIDDCILLCSREVMDVIGQEGMLKLLDEAYDQQEAAEMVADIMEQERPGRPFQFMMSFVEDVFTMGRRGRDRRDTGVHKAISQPISETAMTDETTRFDRSQMVSPYSAAAAGLVPTPEEKKAEEERAAEEARAHEADEAFKPVPETEEDEPEVSAEAEQAESEREIWSREQDTARSETSETDEAVRSEAQTEAVEVPEEAEAEEAAEEAGQAEEADETEEAEEAKAVSPVYAEDREAQDGAETADEEAEKAEAEPAEAIEEKSAYAAAGVFARPEKAKEKEAAERSHFEEFNTAEHETHAPAEADERVSRRREKEAAAAAAAAVAAESERPFETARRVAVTDTMAAELRGREKTEGFEEAYEKNRDGRSGRILLTVLILILLALAMLGIWWMLKSKEAERGTRPAGQATVTSTIRESQAEGKTSQSAAVPSNESESTTAAVPETTAAEPTESEAPEQTTAAATTEAGTTEDPQAGIPTVKGEEGGTYPETYRVKEGDVPGKMLANCYADYDLSNLYNEDVLVGLLERFLELNPDDMKRTEGTNNFIIFAETELKVPDPSGILTPKQ